MGPHIDLSGLPNVPMRVLVFVIFILSTFATIGMFTPGVSYLMSNYFIILLGIWAERDTSPIPVQFFFFGLVFTFVTDIISVSIFMSQVFYLGSTTKFNAAMAIFLIIAKLVIGLFVYKEWQLRAGNDSDQSNYETLGGQPNAPGYTGDHYKSDMPPHYQPPNSQPFP